MDVSNQCTTDDPKVVLLGRVGCGHMVGILHLVKPWFEGETFDYSLQLLAPKSTFSPTMNHALNP